MEEDTQQKIAQYRLLEMRLNALLKQRELLQEKIFEVESTLSFLEDLSTTEDVIFPVGSGVFSFGRIQNKDKLIILIGSNTAIEMDLENAKKFLKEKTEAILNSFQKLDFEINETISLMNKLGNEISKKLK